MNKQQKKKLNKPGQKHWNNSELQRVSRVFELLVSIDQRLKKGKSNENKSVQPNKR